MLLMKGFQMNVELAERTEEHVLIFWEKTQDAEIKRMLLLPLLYSQKLTKLPVRK